jgi:hypothetical protein
MTTLGFFVPVLTSLVSSVQSKLPKAAQRRGVSATVTIIAIVAIIAVGGVLTYVLLTSAGTTTSSTYP